MTASPSVSAVIRAADPISDTTTDPSWTPVVVTARLAEPVLSIGAPMHLDGPLAWCAWLAARDRGLVLPPMSPTRCTDLRLPLATWTAPAPQGCPDALMAPSGRVWGWAASRAIVDGAGSTAVEIRKRPATQEFARFTRDRRHHDGLGAHKARNITLPGRLISQITWHALGDLDGIADLLIRLRALGRVTGHGNGRVLSVTVRAGADRDAWRDRDFPGAGPAVGSVRAPYWHPTRRCSLAA